MTCLEMSLNGVLIKGTSILHFIAMGLISLTGRVGAVVGMGIIVISPLTGMICMLENLEMRLTT